MKTEAPFDRTKLRNPSGMRYTKQLFHEQWVMMSAQNRVQAPIFSLYSDKPGLVNFGREYIAFGDPNGYEMAMKYFGEYDSFVHLLKCPWFREAKTIWDREIEAKMYATGLKKLQEMAQGEGPLALQAAKLLVTKQYKQKTPSRGRPSKEEVQGELSREVSEAKQVQDDASRILKIV